MKRLLTALTPCLFLCAQVLAADAPTQKPNIILILADDLGYGDVGCFGATDIRTPHLDKMAAEGLLLTSFYAQPICGPSRAALMTGCYPIRIGEVQNGKNGHTLPHTKEVTMAEMLRDAGYRTGIVGKWHLGMKQACDPLSQGFEHAYFTPAFNGASRDIKPNASFPFLRKPGEVAREIRSQTDMDTLTADCTREALEFMRGTTRNQEQSTFLPLPRLSHAACAARRVGEVSRQIAARTLWRCRGGTRRRRRPGTRRAEKARAR